MAIVLCLDNAFPAIIQLETIPVEGRREDNKKNEAPDVNGCHFRVKKIDILWPGEQKG